MEQAQVWIAAILGIVTFFIVEAIKLWNKAKGVKLPTGTVVWALFLVSLILTVIGGVVTGDLDFTEFLEGMASIPTDPALAFAAVIQLLQQLITMIGVVIATATAVYGALKEKIEGAGLLSYSVSTPRLE